MEPKIKTNRATVRLATGTRWAFAGKLIAGLSGVGVNMLLARLMTPDVLGAYFLGVSLVAASALIGRFGLGTVVVRLVAEARAVGDDARARAIAILVIKLVSFIGVVIAIIFGAFIFPVLGIRVFNIPYFETAAFLFVVWIFLMVIQTTLAEIFRGFHDIKNATLFSGLSLSLIMLCILSVMLVFKLSTGFQKVLELMVGALTFSVLISIVILRGWICRKPQQKAVKVWELVSPAFPIFLSTLSFFLLAQADIWLLAAARPEAEVALYAAAKRLVLLVAMPLQVIAAVLPPMIAELNSQGKLEDLQILLRSAATLAGIPSAIALFVAIFFGDTIMGVLYGQYYREGAVILAVLCVGQMVNVWAGTCGFALNMTGHHKTMMVITACTGVITLLGAYGASIHFGGIGVASAVAAGQVVQNFLMIAYTRKRLGIWTHMDMDIPKALRLLKR